MNNAKYFIGSFTKDPAILKYKYDDQVKYQLDNEVPFIDANGQEVIENGKPLMTKYKQYFLKETGNISLLIDRYTYSLFPIPMLNGFDNIYTKDGKVVLSITKTESGTPIKNLNYDLLESNTEFYTDGDVYIANSVGDIYYDAANQVFKILKESTYSIDYYDKDAIVDPEYSSDGSLILDGSTITEMGLDDDGNEIVIVDSNGAPITKTIKYTYGVMKSLTISQRDWVICDTVDTDQIYINKYSGKIWTREVNDASN